MYSLSISFNQTTVIDKLEHLIILLSVNLTKMLHRSSSMKNKIYSVLNIIKINHFKMKNIHIELV